ncbi:YlmC/YmxH family sporulation protein [Paenibacillus chibensis]|uniref:YlmC/YmxH family sporulation protein n=2 Tax=Paenibacillus chibensis TaxID=59846 RepID=A0ABU6Q1R7_9BACL|nr:YlmC/YmxH family sporulation protein [Paenibacillus chibensis]
MSPDQQAVEKNMKISDFQTKDVINIVDGRRLGQISDLELDLRQGRIDAIVVPSNSKFLGLFGGGADLIIPWRNIVKIGSDVVLVKMEEIKTLQDEKDALAYAERQERDRRNFRDL